eukprot:TRINITY_DN3258_c0_g3_i2.p1 TRINITY_DN3258_c0_g3~~TRINITY_DN3258_c0_g3_i2.p1  ORF type:complete len:362 (-),score=22.15 TRINITY_DN3258_c0_g3_i2:1113-2198(-)
MGNFLVTSSLCARISVLLEYVPESQEAIAKELSNILSNPLINTSNSVASEELLHHFLFNMELLYKRGIVDRVLRPSNLSIVVSRLHYHEPECLFLCDLLSSGTLQHHANSASSVEQAALVVIQILAHYFNRVYLSHDWREICKNEQVLSISGERPTLSMPTTPNIELDPLPDDVENIINQANRKTIQLFVDYLRSLVGSLRDPIPVRLPYSKVQISQWQRKKQPASKVNVISNILNELKVLVPYQVRSPFYALRGFGDGFTSVKELIEQMTVELQVDPGALPLFQRLEIPLNSYAVDFYITNNYKKLIQENGLRDGDCWEALKDWMLLFVSLSHSIVKDGSQFCEGLQYLAQKFRAQYLLV